MAKDKFIKLSVPAHLALLEEIRILTIQAEQQTVEKIKLLNRLRDVEASNALQIAEQNNQLIGARRDYQNEQRENAALRKAYKILGRNFIRLQAVVQSCAPAVKMPDLEEMKTKDGKSWP